MLSFLIIYFFIFHLPRFSIICLHHLVKLVRGNIISERFSISQFHILKALTLSIAPIFTHTFEGLYGIFFHIVSSSIWTTFYLSHLMHCLISNVLPFFFYFYFSFITLPILFDTILINGTSHSNI